MLTFIFVCSLIVHVIHCDHWHDRENLIKTEEDQAIGSSIILNAKEQIANNILMTHKAKECDEGFQHPEKYLAAKHFFEARDDIEKSEVFKFIQKMPKGAALHGHDLGLVSEEYLYNITLKDNLYGCVDGKGKLRLMFYMHPKQDLSCNWKLVSDLRREDPTYDKWLRSKLTLKVDNPREVYAEHQSGWDALNDVFNTVIPMLPYKPVFIDYFYRTLQELYEDNVMYLEFRGILPKLYELDGTTYSELETARYYQEMIETFKSTHPGFLGAQIIYAPIRDVDNATVKSYLKILKDIKTYYPKLLAGFDLVGQEDAGKPLIDFVKELKTVAGDTNFMFHSAETNWYGSSTDFNIIDAILLGTKRIGHGFGLIKHPLAMQLVKERNIAVEVCPISNQVLNYVGDMRNHPAAILISQGFPVVISYDDPSFWATKGLSYDFYMAFMGIASHKADLRLLKQLAKNSLIYTVMPENEKQLAIAAWEDQWDKFINNITSGREL